MRAAIYARKSTDENDRDGDDKSVTRQIRRVYAVAKGVIVEGGLNRMRVS